MLLAAWQNRPGQKATSGLGQRASPFAVGGRAPSVRSGFQAERHAAIAWQVGEAKKGAQGLRRKEQLTEGTIRTVRIVLLQTRNETTLMMGFFMLR